ncbi:MAG TPA: Ppx/GppA phosphatase family protein [Acetobacteraceae bacterium]|nr:Ppx/GppA phosphatase family protein [Acetobacteraceae bacterium]
MLNGNAPPADEPASQTRRLAGPAFAALDLGTNNCRMLVGVPATNGFRVLDSFSRIVRLGEGLHETGCLGAAGMQRALDALQACTVRLARRPVRRLRAIATEACRRAANGPDFLARVRHDTGLTIDVISSREEAELALESCAPLLAGAVRRALLFDIGGGSTELAWVRVDSPGRPALIGYASLPVGVVTLAERFGPSGFTEAGFEAMVGDVSARLAAFESVHCIGREIRCGGVQLLGTSGTVTTLAGVALELPRYRRPLIDGVVLTREVAGQAMDQLRALGRDGLERHPCVGPERLDFVLPGCAIFAAITAAWPAPQVVVADRGLREGMLLRMIRADRARPARLWPLVAHSA